MIYGVVLTNEDHRCSFLLPNRLGLDQALV